MELIIKILVVILLALTPAMLWWWQIQKSSPRSKKNLIITFVLGGFLSTGLAIGIQLAWLEFRGGPGLYNEVEKTVGLLAMVALVGVIEEVGKWLTVVIIGLNKYQIQSINDALRYSLASALGFAFAENIIYFWRLIKVDKFVDLFASGAVRSTLVIAGHLIFSGIAGYYYGIAKFAKPLSEHAAWKGERFSLAAALGLSRESYYKYTRLVLGLLLAVGIHALYNVLLRLGSVELNFVIVIAGIFYLLHLLSQRGGRLVLGLKTQQKSTMNSKDESVVLELMGRFINAGHYKEVIEIGDRLLKRDPLNPVIHIFIAEAYQKLEFLRARLALTALFTDEEYREKESILRKKD